MPCTTVAPCSLERCIPHCKAQYGQCVAVDDMGALTTSSNEQATCPRQLPRNPRVIQPFRQTCRFDRAVAARPPRWIDTNVRDRRSRKRQSCRSSRTRRAQTKQNAGNGPCSRAAACDERPSCSRSCWRAERPRSVRSRPINNRLRSDRHRRFRIAPMKRFPHGCASAANSANASKGSRTAGFTPERDDSYFLSRLRVNAVVTPGRLFSATVQLQDARVAQKQVGPTTPPFRGPLDLRMAYADIGDVQKGARVGPCGTAGACVRRAAAHRTLELDQHRADLRWRPRHDPARWVSGRRLRCVGRADPGRLVRRERQRQSTRRRLRLALGARHECGRRAVLLLARRPRAAH